MNVEVNQLVTLKHVTAKPRRFRETLWELSYVLVVDLIRSFHYIMGLAKHFIDEKSSQEHLDNM